MFVRQSQLAQIAEVTGEPEGEMTAKNSPKSPIESGLKRPGIPAPTSVGDKR